ncbi:solute carrier family 43 member 3-like isoform X2 [Pomacea canaliculata]|uniref:solute carrier family 43 member 3-like isoform X2 n=1 Tax=Pomacea canaliculata TaxID=400727 RepID=UPI000D7388C5|nr:solute carrier family 43 member 3-like isoform X2 [Pomacea canaliculata]
MAEGVCHKKTAALLWTLLECVFFSGVVLGWSWLALVFQADGYFLGHCFDNATNITNAAVSGDSTAGPQGTTGRRCQQRPRGVRGSTAALLAHPSSTYEPTSTLLSHPTSTYEPMTALLTRPSQTFKPTAALLSSHHPTNEPTAALFSQPLLTQEPTSTPFSDMQVSGQTEVSGSSTKLDPLEATSATSSSASLRPFNGPENGGLPRPQHRSCPEQMERLRLLFAVSHVLRDLLMLPVGAFMDKYGTTRTRLLSVLIFALGTLMMTFTSAGFPWLVVPALTLTGVAGVAVLLTNLQIANLFGSTRHLVIAFYCGASLSSSVIAYLMQLSHSEGVNVQTSFMFLTIGLVPMLVSTVAFLPKTRVPWPLPVDYGKRRHQSLDENLLRKQRAWQRRLSEAGAVKLRRPSSRFWPTTRQRLFVGTVTWHAVHALHVAVMETRLVDLGHWSHSGYSDLQQFGWLQLLGVVLAPLPGLLLDKRGSRQPDIPLGTQQMQNVVPAILVTSLLAALELVSSIPAVVSSPLLSFFFHISHRVFHLTTSYAVLMHMHFPQEHLGKYVGLMLTWTAILGTTQFPIRVFLHQQQLTIVPPVHIALLVQSLLTMVHALNVWNCCRRRLIRDQPTHDNSQRSMLHA